MKYTISINGALGDEASSHISVLDRGFLYGDSVYEVLRTYNGCLFAVDEHLARLKHSAEGLGMDLPSPHELRARLNDVLAAAGHPEAYCRLIITRGSGPLSLDPNLAVAPQTIIIVKAYEPFPAWMYEKGVELAVPGLTRASHPSIKSGNYLNSVLALGLARSRGFDDALLVNADGYITEGTTSNVFALEGRALLTPPLASGLLAGVTRQLIFSVAEDEGLEVREEPLDVDRIRHADEVMLTSTLREVMPVIRIEEDTIGNGTPGPVAQALRTRFHAKALMMVQPTSSER